MRHVCLVTLSSDTQPAQMYSLRSTDYGLKTLKIEIHMDEHDPLGIMKRVQSQRYWHAKHPQSSCGR